MSAMVDESARGVGLERLDATNEQDQAVQSDDSSVPSRLLRSTTLASKY
jgi:hypothetical protein